MKEGILEQLAKKSGLVISDFHDPKNYNVMYEFLKKTPMNTFTLHEETLAVQYALNIDDITFSTKDELLTYFEKWIIG